ncbi:hypothetical protein ACJJTC_004684 [Scirpophaga incertulas]
MEELIKRRTVARRFFTIAEKDVGGAFDSGSKTDLPALIKYFEDKAEDMFDIDQKIKDQLFQSDADDEQIFSELESAEKYRLRYHKVRAQFSIDMSQKTPSVDAESYDGVSGTVKCYGPRDKENPRTGKVDYLSERFVKRITGGRQRNICGGAKAPAT